jgi:hypothetical protein
MTIISLSNYIKQNQSAFNAIKAVHSSGVHFNWADQVLNLNPSQYIDLNSTNLFIDTANQRNPFVKTRIKKLQYTVQNPCPVKFKTIIVAQYIGDPNPNNLYIIDGQGRAISALAMGITHVPYTLVRFPSRLAMTSYFMTQNHNTNSLNTAQKHLVSLANTQYRGHGVAKDLHRAYSSVNGSCCPQTLKGDKNLVDFTGALGALEQVLAMWNPANKPTPTGQRVSQELNGLLDVLTLVFTNPRSKTNLILWRKTLYPTAEWLRIEIDRLVKLNPKTPYETTLNEALLNLQTKLMKHIVAINTSLQKSGLLSTQTDYQKRFLKRIGGATVQGGAKPLKGLWKNI